MSGVHYAVQRELQELAGLHPRETIVLGRPEFFPRLPNLHPIPLWTSHPAGRLLWQQLLLPRLLKRLHADALFAPAYTAPLATDVPVLLQVHDIIALDHPELCDTKNALALRLLLPKSIRRASRVIVPTQHVADRIADRLRRTDAIPIQMGADTHDFSRPTQNPRTKPYWLFVGNIEPKKGLPVLLDAYAASSRPFDLVVAGRPAWKSAPILKKLRSTRGPGEIHLAGRLSEQGLAAHMQHAQALILPSSEEGCGLPLLEALACGTPVIYSEHPALLQTAAGNGLHFPVGDARALARLLDRFSPRDNPIPAGNPPSWRQWAAFFWKTLAVSP